MLNRLILISISASLTFSTSVFAKKKVEFSLTPYGGYRQDQIRWKTSTGDSQKWKNLRGIEYGLKSEVTLIDRYKIYLDFGFANLFNGTMTDSNYLAAPGSGNPANNNLKGSGFIFEPNLAFGFNMKPSKSFDLIPMIGISYDLIKLSGKKSSTNPLTSLSNKLNFYGPYVGAKAKLKLGKKLTMDAGAAFKLAFYNGSGNWKFTGDATSNTMSQSGHGYGLRGSFGLSYLLVKSITLGAEAAVEWNRISNGNDKRKFAGGTTTKSKLKSLNWTTLSGRVTLAKSF